MKKIYSFLVFIIVGYACFSQGSWTQKANFPGVGRELPTGFSIDSMGYVGCGSGGGYLNDFWQYNPSTNVWTQKANLPGTGRYGAVGFSIGHYGYIGTGRNYNTGETCNDFWEYDPAANTWTRKANYGGGGRSFGGGFSIGSKGYIVTGVDSNFSYHADCWEWDQATNVWTQKANIPAPRDVPVGFSIYNKGYIGTGEDASYAPLNDFWEFDPVLNTWTQKAPLPAVARVDATGFSLCGMGYLGTKGECPCLTDFWQFDPALNVWTQKANIPGIGFDDATAFVIGNKGYIALGDASSLLNTLYEFTPDSNSLCTQCVLAARFVSSDTAFCSEPGRCVSFTDLSTCNATSWQWHFPGASPDTSTQQNPTNICYGITGTYAVTLIVANATGSDSLTVSPLITVGTPTPPVITMSGDTLYSTHASHYQWYYNGVAINGSTASFYYPACAPMGSYSVQIVDSNGCSSLSVAFVCEGVNELNGSVIKIYPNPVSQSAVINLSEGLLTDQSTVNGITELKLIDVTGREIYTQQPRVAVYGLRTAIDVSSLSNGVYILRISSEKGAINKKIIVER